MSDYAIDERKFPRVFVLRKRVRASLWAMGTLTGELFREAGTRRLKPAGAPFCIYYEKPEDPRNVDYELCLPVDGAGDALAGLPEFGGDNCLHLVHKGSYKGLGAAYEALTAHIADENRGMAGPPREVYTRGPFLGFLPIGMVTELYFPVTG